jgi:hypothetical protein
MGDRGRQRLGEVIKALLVDRRGAPEAARERACEQYRTSCGTKPVISAFAKAGDS